MAPFLERLRAAEVDKVKPYFRQGDSVLEIGGGNGWQAGIVASWRCNVRSIDLQGHFVPTRQYYPVQDYDGRHIPSENGEFDIVFSSNVLEHVPDLPSMFAEIQRVLKPRGLAIHILPTPAWRVLTSLSHYAFLLKRLLGIKQHDTPMKQVSAQPVWHSKGWFYLLKKALIAGPHGEYSSAVSELYFFSRGRWMRAFAENGFTLIEDFGTGLCYTGYTIFPGMSFGTRRSLARFLGSACRVYVMRRD